MDVTHDGQVLAGGLEILPKRKDVGSLRGQILQRGQDFFYFLAKAQHQARLSRNFRMGLLGAAQELERSFVDGTFAHLAVEARDRFGVVIEDIGLGGQDYVESIPVTPK